MDATFSRTAELPFTPRLSTKALIFHLVAGVLLPLVTFGTEAWSGICADVLLNPLPTWWHAALVFSVPIANAWFIWSGRRKDPLTLSPEAEQWLDRVSAWTTGVAACYALVFLPFSPFAVIGILFFGFGLLPLAPILSFVSALLLRRAWRRTLRAQGNATLASNWQIAVGILAVIFGLAPLFITDWAVHRLGKSNDPSIALFWLRNVADETRLLENATEENRFNLIHEMTAPRASAEDYRRAYYRATGRTISQLPPQKRGLFSRPRDRREWRWDAKLGEQAVGLPQPHLNLIESKLEAVATGATATGYTEWTLVFRNAHEFQQAEARALIQLPAGGVVSRLTLWVDGEEREAAFGGRSQVTQAYKAVVSQRRDPALVTDKGADRVLMQCFPVQPKQGEMKVRLGITYPLVPAPEGTCRAIWPRFIQNNFTIAEKFTHFVWASTDGEISEISNALQRDPTNPQALRGSLNTSELMTGNGSFAVACSFEETVFGIVPDGTQRRIRQTYAQQPGVGTDLAIVLDGSASMAEAGRSLAAALAQLPDNLTVKLWLSGDHLRSAPAATARGVAEWLREQTFAGGQDDTRALLAAYDSVQGRAQAAVLWIHGAQSHTWTDSAPLVQRFARGRSPVALYDYSQGWSENSRFGELAAATSVRRIDPLGKGSDEMLRVLHHVIEPSWQAKRVLEIEATSTAASSHASKQIGRLWVREEVDRLMRGDRPHHSDAVALAQKSQLVTAVTSAVVLETQAQYDDAGLKPVDPASTPSVPEPATFALIGGALIFAFACYQRRRRVLSKHAVKSECVH